jgi:hypothetical protein
MSNLKKQQKDKGKNELLIEEILSKKLDDIITNCDEYDKYKIPMTKMNEPIENSYPYIIPPLIVKALGKRLTKIELSNPFIAIDALRKDMEIFENFIKDPEYRKRYNQIKNTGAMPIYDIDGRLITDDNINDYKYGAPDLMHLKRLILDRIGLPSNTSFRYEKIKCLKKCSTRGCRHEYYYFFAYYWDSKNKKLKKKYLGRNLPLPCKISISN